MAASVYIAWCKHERVWENIKVYPWNKYLQMVQYMSQYIVHVKVHGTLTKIVQVECHICTM